MHPSINLSFCCERKLISHTFIYCFAFKSWGRYIKIIFAKVFNSQNKTKWDSYLVILITNIFSVEFPENVVYHIWHSCTILHISYIYPYCPRLTHITWYRLKRPLCLSAVSHCLLQTRRLFKGSRLHHQLGPKSEAVETWRQARELWQWKWEHLSHCICPAVWTAACSHRQSTQCWLSQQQHHNNDRRDFLSLLWTW